MLRLYELRRAAEREPLDSGVAAGTALAASPDSRLLAVGGRRGEVQLRRERDLVQLLGPGDGGPTLQLAFSRDGALLAALSSRLALWSVAEQRPLDLPALAGTSFAWLPERRLLLADGRRLSLVGPEFSATALPEVHAGALRAVAASPDGSRWATAGDDRVVRLWDGASRAPLQSLDGHEEPVLALAFSATGRYLASGSLDGSVRLWDVQTGRLVRALDTAPWTPGQVLALAFGALGEGAVSREVLFASNTQARLLAWEVPSGALRISQMALSGQKWTALAPLPGALALLSSDGVLKRMPTVGEEALAPPEQALDMILRDYKLRRDEELVLVRDQDALRPAGQR
jgi:WD40 repeat protein